MVRAAIVLIYNRTHHSFRNGILPQGVEFVGFLLLASQQTVPEGNNLVSREVYSRHQNLVDNKGANKFKREKN